MMKGKQTMSNKEIAFFLCSFLSEPIFLSFCCNTTANSLSGTKSANVVANNVMSFSVPSFDVVWCDVSVKVYTYISTKTGKLSSVSHRKFSNKNKMQTNCKNISIFWKNNGMKKSAINMWQNRMCCLKRMQMLILNEVNTNSKFLYREETVYYK